MFEPIEPDAVPKYLTPAQGATVLSRPRVLRADAATRRDPDLQTAYLTIGQQVVRLDELEDATTISLAAVRPVPDEANEDSHPLAAVDGDILRAFEWLRAELDRGRLDALVLRALRRGPAVERDDLGASAALLDDRLCMLAGLPVTRHRRTLGRVDGHASLEHFLVLPDAVADAPAPVGNLLHATVAKGPHGYRLTGYLTDAEDVGRVPVVDEELACPAILATDHLTRIVWARTLRACQAITSRDVVTAIARAAVEGVALTATIPPFDVFAAEAGGRDPRWHVTLEFAGELEHSAPACLINTVRRELGLRGVDLSRLVIEKAPR